MRHLQLLFTLCLVLFSLRGDGKTPGANSRSDSQTFVGTWIGEYQDPQYGRITWVQQRHADGSYRIVFTQHGSDGTKANRTESGKWWIRKGKFYELSDQNQEKPDVYDYTIKSPSEIFFSKVGGGYQFSDIRLSDTDTDSPGAL